MSNGISFSGLSSGLDTDSIVTALTKVETTQNTALQAKQTTLKLRQAAYATIKTQLSAVARAAGTLNTASAFSTMKASADDATIAGIATTSSAAAGTYDLNVTKLAKANKIASAAQNDTTTALGKTGTASVNGKAFTIDATDSLTNVAQKINGLGAGVKASVLNGGTGRSYLTISSSTSGTANAVTLSDLGGTTFADLGLIGSTSSVRQTSGTTAVGLAFASSSATLQTDLGATGLSASTVTINGTSIALDPTTDSLDSLASKINAAGIDGVTASVQAASDGTFNLQIAGKEATPTISDTGGLMRGLGILRADPSNQLVAAQDAAYTLDGVSLTSSTNSVSDVLPGATITLKAIGDTSLDVAQDTSGIEDNVTSLVSSVNDMISGIKAQSTFDSSTFNSGVLFGDSIAEQAKDSVVNLLFSDASGVGGNLKNLASIGVGLDTDGNVTFDKTAFESALSSNPDGVAALFRAVGTGSTNSIKYVSSTTDSKASATSAGYQLNVTQAATRGSFVAGTASTGTRSAAETLTFHGSAFGSGMAVTLDAGTNLDDTVRTINADSRLKDLVAASVENGKLRIDAKKYGTGGNFTLTSNYSSSSSNSGVGVGGEGTTVAGLDIAGTINGEAATGSGQFLTGASGNANTAGLQLLYSGTDTGVVGTLAFSKGAASKMQSLLNTFTDSTNGLLTAADNSLTTQISGLDDDMATITARIASKTQELKDRFSAMESAIAQLKSQSSTVSSMLSSSSSS